jgi:hypothetical protein
MRCVQNKWGTGSCSVERQSDVQSETAKKLQTMLSERAKQDAKWSTPTTCTSSELKHPSQVPSSSERDRYAASLR